jgi:hypothetical protein
MEIMKSSRHDYERYRSRLRSSPVWQRRRAHAKPLKGEKKVLYL